LLVFSAHAFFLSGCVVETREFSGTGARCKAHALAGDEALLAMARIAAEAQRFGVRWVLTFVGEENTASIKGCNRAGFLPYVTRHESWRFLRRKVNFMPLPQPNSSKDIVRRKAS
jgi:hypothetical protein